MGDIFRRPVYLGSSLSDIWGLQSVSVPLWGDLGWNPRRYIIYSVPLWHLHFVNGEAGPVRTDNGKEVSSLSKFPRVTNPSVSCYTCSQTGSYGLLTV